MTDKTPFIVHCGECKHEWAAFYVPCNFTRAAELLKNANCPMCMAGAYNVFCGPAPVEKKDDWRLRQYPDVKLPNEAADRIEKLESALWKILAQCSWYNAAAYDDVEAIIRKALEGKDD